MSGLCSLIASSSTKTFAGRIPPAISPLSSWTLQSRGLNKYARQLLGEYLEITGDFELLNLLRFYKSYRAMVRAKIALFTRAAPGMSEAKQEELLQTYRQYADLAESLPCCPAGYALSVKVSAVPENLPWVGSQ